ncbi:MAG: ribosome-associated translation inhibitor RaiA [Phycisphaerales bacterium]
MRINVIGRQFEITDPIRLHAEKKAEKLSTYKGFVQQMDYRIWKESPSKEQYAVELTVDVEHREDFIAKVEGPDVYSAIDEVVTKADRQLHDHREKLKSVR